MSICKERGEKKRQLAVFLSHMNSRIRDKKIIITGASGGLGEQFAWQVAENGGTPIMIARSLDKLQQIRDRLRDELGVKAFIYQADLSDGEQIDRLFPKLLSVHMGIDALINNAGFGRFESVSEMNWEETLRMFELNVFALIRCTRHVLPHFLEKQQGHIINIASQAGKIATPKSAAYSATKHAVIGFTNVLRQETANTGVYVTSVNLGPVRTNFFNLADPGGGYVRSVDRYMLDPEKVAGRVTGALFTKKREINMPWWMDTASRMYQMFPGVMETLLKKQFNKK